jgi:phage shock protein A
MEENQTAEQLHKQLKIRDEQLKSRDEQVEKMKKQMEELMLKIRIGDKSQEPQGNCYCLAHS